MSLPYEQINAQKRLWNYFVDGVFPRKHWPKHMLMPAELIMLFEDIEMYKEAYFKAYKEFPSDENPKGILWKDYAEQLEKLHSESKSIKS
jgi:hypothetical protein